MTERDPAYQPQPGKDLDRELIELKAYANNEISDGTPPGRAEASTPADARQTERITTARHNVEAASAPRRSIREKLKRGWRKGLARADQAVDRAVELKNQHYLKAVDRDLEQMTPEELAEKDRVNERRYERMLVYLEPPVDYKRDYHEAYLQRWEERRQLALGTKAEAVAAAERPYDEQIAEITETGLYGIKVLPSTKVGPDSFVGTPYDYSLPLVNPRFLQKKEIEENNRRLSELVDAKLEARHRVLGVFSGL